MAIGTFASCALTREGQVYCWGNSQKSTPLGREPAAGAPGNQAVPPLEIAPGDAPAGLRYRAIGVGPGTACAAREDHKLYCWGDGNELPQPQPRRSTTRRSTTSLSTPVNVPLGEVPGNATIEEIAF